MLSRCTISVCLALLLLSGTGRAQDDTSEQEDAVQRRMGIFVQTMLSLGPEGEVLDVVSVPQGWGDGRVTTPRCSCARAILHMGL